MPRTAIFSAFILLSLGFGGCVSAPKVSSPAISRKPIAGVTYHKVAKGQTLWRIARLYGMEVEDLASLNNILDSSKLEVNQQLIIPSNCKIKVSLPDNPDEDFIWPLKGKIVNAFSQTVNNTVNKGLNIEPSRSLDVQASRSGVVAFYNRDFLDLGKTVILEHPEGFWTVYGRNQEVYVKPGDAVAKGTTIAKAGSAGRDDKVYLHFELRKGSKSENPLFYLP